MDLESVKIGATIQIEPVRKEYKGKSTVINENQPTKHATDVLNVPIFNTGEKAVPFGDGKEEKEKQLKAVMEQVNNKLKITRTRCEYSRNNNINRTAIKIIDEETGDVIREIPPEDTIKMIEKLWKVAGILVDEKF